MRLIWGVLVHGVVGILGANDVYVATVVSAAPVNEKDEDGDEGEQDEDADQDE